MKNWWQQLQSRIQVLPESQPEDSILFRVLTQSLVTIGILATDMAAETHLGLWAIPLSAIGASWSADQRRKKNTGFKFLLAIAMIIALFAFMTRLPAALQAGDTRLILAEFLIQVQVLHTFDLPRRKDLGYSMMIGLVLLALASTLSQTMRFGVLLVAFLAIALPVLMLDYSSRLGVSSLKSDVNRLKKVTFGKLPMIFAIVTALGLVFFMLMPRLPGYQLRMFPVSSPVAVQERFDNQVIRNPGAGQNALESEVRGGGSPKPGGERQSLNDRKDEFYQGFGDKISQNPRPKLKPRVIMRVRSQIEGFWRVMAFDRYTGQGWEISRNAKTRTVTRSPWSYRFFLAPPVTMSRTREVIQTFKISSEMPNLIPALSAPRELYFPTDEIAVDQEFGLRSPVELQSGMTYSVISDVPYRDRTVLRLNSSKVQYPENSPYLQLPPGLRQRLAKETERILATSEQPIESDYEKALYLGQYLKQRYRIQEFQALKPDEDLVEAFLANRGGDRDHFSTALTVMLRSIGVPARLVAGYAPGQFNPFTGLYVVRNTDAYAITEIQVPRSGWFTIDPIPGHELIPPSVEEYQPFSLIERFWNWVAGWLPSPVSAWFNEIFKSVRNALSWFFQLFNQGLSGFFTATIVLTGVGFLGWLSFQGWQKWRQHQRSKHLRPMERLYQTMLHQLARQGFQKHSAETPLEYARHARKVQSRERAVVIEEISQAYVSWRYGKVSPNLPVLQQKLKQLKTKRA
ncbi:MAG: DUF3488 and DUF4129 domain-containing transglutaminase family protein [Leptolyngbya sp. Prado105]|jgi:transglutaminase-like putative cysteine protease|nr:DUF3488 and DUF4129 domain-containing transglutaminase family protein [Leptolyngbya sp. Prado105]